MTTKLLPCPQCGKSNAVIKYVKKGYANIIRCFVCDEVKTESDWNRRAR